MEGQHTFRIPMEFDMACVRWHCSFARGPTGAFWFGVLMVLMAAWGLWIEYQKEWADLKRSLGWAGIMLGGVYMIVSGAFGYRM